MASDIKCMANKTYKLGNLKMFSYEKYVYVQYSIISFFCKLAGRFGF